MVYKGKMPQTRSFETYLVLKPKGGYSGLSGRLASRPPSLAKDEIAVKLNVELPDMLFKRPQLAATVVIPDSAASPQIVDATVLDNVQQVLQQQTGFDVTVRLVENTA